MAVTRKLALIDKKVVLWMRRHGHRFERWALGILFAWFGLLKIFDQVTATSIIAKSVYWFDASLVVPVLGWWEVLIGLCLVIPNAQRLAIFLLAIRLPGTFLALYYHAHECFESNIFIPTIQGQYLLKELAIVGAALVIGGAVSLEKSRPRS